MKMLDLLKNTRTVRRFEANYPIDSAVFDKIAEGLHYLPCAGNLQRIRYVFVTEKQTCDKVFPLLKFAAQLTEWQGPSECERPAGYVVLLTEKAPDTNLAVDVGIASEAIVLLAKEEGIGACILASFDHEKMNTILDVDGYRPVLVIALGKPSEKVKTLDVSAGESLKYYRDENDVHVVPKLTPKDLVLKRM